MPLNPYKRIANGLSKITQGHRLVKDGEKDVRAGVKALRSVEKARTTAAPMPEMLVCTDGLGNEYVS